MPKQRDYDPLSVIPSAAVVEQRLQRIREQARKLKILLRTARELEAERTVKRQTADDRQGVVR